MGPRILTIPNIIAASKGDSHVRVIEFRRNFGQTAAMAAGLDAARFHGHYFGRRLAKPPA